MTSSVISFAWQMNPKGRLRGGYQRTRRIERREEWFSAQSSCTLETSATKIFQELANQACLAGKANNRFSCQAHMQKSVFSKGLTAPTDSSNSVSVVRIASSQPVFWEFLPESWRRQGRSQDFSKGGGSHCVKVRVLIRLSLWPRYRHCIFATCCRLFG